MEEIFILQMLILHVHELVSAMESSDMVRIMCHAQKTNTKPGEYKVNFQPTNIGKYQLHIKVDGMHTEGSPFAVNVINNFDTCTSSAPEFIAGVQCPQGIAMNKRGEIIVVEYMQHCVSIFDPSGKKLKSFETKGSGKGQFYYPCGVALDEDDNILVTDGRNDRIQKFTPDGEVVTAIV